MPEAFDPYRKWLGIPPKDQPPNHYRLLAIELFEDDPDVIESAADQRMAHVRTYQAGKNSALSQKILNELSAAKICLLDPKKKSLYDQKLRQELAATVLQPPADEELVAEVEPLADSDATISPIVVRRSSAKSAQRPSWQLPAVIAIGSLLVLAAFIWLINRNRRNEPPEATAQSIAQVKVGPTTNSPDRPPLAQEAGKETTNVAKKEPKSKSTAAVGHPLSLVAKPSHRPETAGVVADRIVIWNTHNADHRDRGTRECNLSLWRDEHEVWRQDGIEIEWSHDEERNVSVAIPPERFDRVRVEVTKWENFGGGLAEFEVFRGDRNLALGCPAVSAVSLDARFTASKLTDGIHNSYYDGYWLLPNRNFGWAEVDLSFASPRPCSGVQADQLVIWNTHNANHNDRGALELNVRLSLGEKEVWRQNGIALPWEVDSDGPTTVDLPKNSFDRLRIEIPRWQGLGGGLSEVQVKQGNVNLARACPVIAGGCHSDAYAPAKLVDGMTSSLTDGIGYWLAPDNVAAWFEIDLSPNCWAIGQANRALGQYRALVEKNWLRGLPWLAQSDASELRSLALLDAKDPWEPAELAIVGDGWWDMAQIATGTAQQEILNRALYRYARSIPFLPETDRPRLQERVAQSLPRPEGTWLYLLHEAEVTRVFSQDNLREPVVVKGERRQWGLWMHPYPNETSSAVFSLAKKYRRLAGAVAINDSSQGPATTPLVFKIVADDRTLWASQPLQNQSASEPFEVDVSGVETLQLLVECKGPNDFGHAVWIDPILDPPSS